MELLQLDLYRWNLKSLLKTKWGQWSVYNDIVERMGYLGCPAGCGPVAIAQILAFHKLPQKYDFKTEYHYGHIKDRISELKNWDGTYNWEEMTQKEQADYLSNEGQLHVGALLYHIGRIGNAKYSSSVTNMYDSGIEHCLRCFGFKYDCFSLCGSYSNENISPMKKNWGQIGINVKHSLPQVIGYSLRGIKHSIEHKAPVIVAGYAKKRVVKKSAWWWAWEWEEIEYDSGHYWVIDGYCRLFCKAKNEKTGEVKNIEANYVHYNVGWGGNNNGYYIDELFTFNKPKANAEDHQIRSTYGKDNYYQYHIRMFPVVPR